MIIELPTPSLVLLMGASSSGKSNFARQHFAPTEILSSDHFRALVSDHENNAEATADAFELLYTLADKRLARGLTTVIDATNVRPTDRRKAITLAHAHDLLATGIVLDLPEEELLERHRARADRDFPERIIRRQRSELRRGLKGLAKEGLRHTWRLTSTEDIQRAQVIRRPLFPDKRELDGPFDFIGDVHGCLSELKTLLGKLGYQQGTAGYAHPEGRTAVFVGDLIDRGPDSAGVLALVIEMVQGGAALAVPGNHDTKLTEALKARGNKKWPAELQQTLEQLAARGPEFEREVREFLTGLVSHLVLDSGAVVVAHAGLPERYQGRASRRVRSFALYGDVDGSLDEHGFPLRRDWAAEYKGKALVVYGHTPVPAVREVNHTINIDTGCVFGGQLTALRYPEIQVVDVPAERTYAEPPPSLTVDTEGIQAKQPSTPPFDLATFVGGEMLETRLSGRVRVPAAARAGAAAIYAVHGVDPRFCAYLPPTMSPVATSPDTLALGQLERPAEAFRYFEKKGISKVICEEKHMGSRAILLICQSEEATQQCFGVGGLGTVYTRTGQRFFSPQWESDVLLRASAAVTKARLWETLQTDWLLIDMEVLPWSFKAEELVREQYAAVGAAGTTLLQSSIKTLQAGVQRGLSLEAELTRTQMRLQHLEAYQRAYRRYIRRVSAPSEVQFKPFHLLAAQDRVFTDQNHQWHLEQLAELAAADSQLFGCTRHRIVDLADSNSVTAAITWWENLTAEGGEGMVVKPLNFLPPKGVQPALKVRGSEYLRIIYGPEYLQPEHLSRLLERSLKGKRTRALREFRLGLEGLQQLSEGKPWDSYHPYALGVLALEQERDDARL